MASKHSAIAAGLALTLVFGSIAAPKPAVADDDTPGVASEATDIDKGLYTEQSLAGTLRSVSGVNLVNVSKEMKYFTKYESHGNYNQGFSYGDGYNALGYYQFDRRWSLIPFMRQVYNYNPAKYGMLKSAIDRGNDISNSANAMFENSQLTELGRIAQDAFQGAYAADPAEFSALQDSYAYNSYYAVTESWLKNSLGIDISGRADCVKGMVWSVTNMCGTGGCQDFFRWANLSNDMSDREFVTALSNSVVDNVARKYPNQTRYHEGWKNRYRNELKDCLVYIAEDEAAAAKPSVPAGSTEADSGSDSSSNDASSNGDASGSDSSNDSASNEATPGSSSSNDESNSNAGDSSVSGGSSSKNDGAADGGVSNGSDNGSSDKGDDGSQSDDESVSGSTDSTDDAKSDGKADADAPNDTSKDESGKDSKDDKSESEKLGETVGEALTSGLSKGEEGSKSSDAKSDASANDQSKQVDDQTKSSASTDQKSDAQNKGGTAFNTSSNMTTGKSTTNGGMPHTGDVVIMASLASASLATFGMTAIVSGKNKLKKQDGADGNDGLQK